MTMTRAEYATAKAAIEAEWKGFPGMTAALVHDLDQKMAPPKPPTSAAPPTGSPQRGSGKPTEGLSDRQREFESLRYQAVLAGRSDADADRLARIQLARNHGEPVDHNDVIADLSIEELARHAAVVDDLPFGDDWGGHFATEAEAIASDEAKQAALLADQDSEIAEQRYYRGLQQRASFRNALVKGGINPSEADKFTDEHFGAAPVNPRKPEIPASLADIGDSE